MQQTQNSQNIVEKEKGWKTYFPILKLTTKLQQSR